MKSVKVFFLVTILLVFLLADTINTSHPEKFSNQLDIDIPKRVQEQTAEVEANKHIAEKWQSYLKRDEREMDNYDVLYGKIDLELDFENELIYGNNDLQIEFLEDNVESVILDFTNNLTLDEVNLFGESVDYEHSEHQITVYFDIPYNSGESITLNFMYHGHPVPPSRYGWGLKFASHEGEPIAFTMVEPFASRDWWPCKDIPSDKIAEMDIWITCPENYMAVSNGVLENTIQNDNNTKTFQWHSSYPISTYLVSIAVTNYELYSIEYSYDDQTMLIDNYLFPEQHDDGVSLFQQTPMMLDFLSSVYCEYPFLEEKYGHAVYPGGGAMEHQTCTSFGSNHVSANDYYTVLHELAHQWVGDLITCDDWSEIWLNEGFATYSEVLFSELLGGSEYYHMHMDALDLGNTIDDKLHRDESDNGSYILDIVVYYKGAWVLHMLRGVIGEEHLLSILQTYTQSEEFRFKTATTEDFQNICETVSGMDLDWFFEQWFYHPGRPYYDYTYYYSEEQNEVVIASLAQGSTGYPFSMPVPLEMNDNNHQIFIQDGFNHHILECYQSDISLDWDADNWVLDYGFQYHQPQLQSIEQLRDGSVFLVWNEFFDPEISGFHIFRSEDGESFSQITSSPIAATSFVDTEVIENTTYHYKIAAVYTTETEYLSQFSNTIEATSVDFSLDSGILLVDQTYDYPEGSPMPSDSDVDEFYANLLQGYNYTSWDIAQQGVPPLSEMAQYSSIIWHCDAMNGAPFFNAAYPIKAYSLAGGNIFLSAWKLLPDMDATVLSDVFGIESAVCNPNPDFTGAQSIAYPDIEIDLEKIPMPTWENAIAYGNQFDLLPSSESIYLYDSIMDDPNWQNSVCGVKSDNRILLGFPLYFMNEEPASDFLHQVLLEFGEQTDVTESVISSPIIHLSNYPNPFNPQTTIRYSIAQEGLVQINIYNVKGQHIHKFSNVHHSPGTYSIIWDSKDDKGKPVGSGVYFYTMKMGESETVKKLMLLK